MMVVRFPVIWSLLFVWVMSLSVNAQEATPDVETPFLPDDLEVITVENAGRLEELGAVALPHSEEASEIAFDSSGELLVAAYDDGVARIWNLSTGEIVRSYPSGVDALLSVAFSNDDNLLAAGGTHYSAGGAPGVFIWDVENGEKIAELWSAYGMNGVFGVQFSPDSRFLGAFNGIEVTVWDISSKEQIGGILAHFPFGMEFDLNNQLYAWAWNLEDALVTYDVMVGDELDVLEVPQLARGFLDRNGTFVIRGNYGAPVLYDPLGNGESVILAEYHNSVYNLQNATRNSDGTILVTYLDLDELMGFWNLQTGEMLNQLPSVSASHDIVFSLDDRLIASSGNDGTIRLWGVSSEQGGNE